MPPSPLALYACAEKEESASAAAATAAGLKRSTILPNQKTNWCLLKKEMAVCEETTKGGFGGCDVRQKNHLLTW